MNRVKWAIAVLVCLSAVFAAFIFGYFIGHNFKQERYFVTYEKSTLTAFPSISPAETESEDMAEKIDINTAGTEELCTLNGIGAVIAQRIIEYRNENGDFEFTFEIMNVDGIGENTYIAIKDKIQVTKKGA